MQVLLVNPPSEFLIDENVFPTLGLLYLSSYIKNAGYKDVSLLDLNGNHYLPDSIDADIVGFYSNTPQFPVVLELNKKIKSINKNKLAKYVIGGPHVSGRPQDAIDYFNYVVVGEGEKAFLDIVRSIDSGKPVEEGIKRYEYMKDIDSIPFPDRDLIDIHNYKYIINGLNATTVITSRGCPYRCAFCANNAWGKTIRLRSPENVIEEIKILKNKYGYNAFMFFDDTMTVNKKRMMSICNMIKDLNIIYRCFIRSDTVNREVLIKMKESGCVEVGLGIESGSPRILKIVDKGEKVEQHMQAIRLCREVGIRVKGFFILGLPGENEESIKETTDFLEECNVDDFDITIFTPYPGSIIYQNKEKYDIKFDGDYEDYWYKGKPGHYKSVISTSSLSSEDIVSRRDEIEKRFRGK